jgi:ABC-type uncharacterized transport system YnjBCD substrate-binding protein
MIKILCNNTENKILIIGAFVNTANDEPVTQAELLQWAAENPMPLNEPKKSNSDLMNSLV